LKHCLWLLYRGWLFVAPVTGVVVCGTCVWAGCLWNLRLGGLFAALVRGPRPSS
jgi:hypothetical protein